MKKKIIKICLFLICMILVLANITYGYGFVGNTSQYSGQGNNPIQAQQGKVTNTVISVVRIVAVGTALIMLMVLGMKYMISAPSDRADIKKHLIAYVIGAFIVFGSATIIGILIDLADTIQ